MIPWFFQVYQSKFEANRLRGSLVMFGHTNREYYFIYVDDWNFVTVYFMLGIKAWIVSTANIIYWKRWARSTFFILFVNDLFRYFFCNPSKKFISFVSKILLIFHLFHPFFHWTIDRSVKRLFRKIVCSIKCFGHFHLFERSISFVHRWVFF